MYTNNSQRGISTIITVLIVLVVVGIGFLAVNRVFNFIKSPTSLVEDTNTVEEVVNKKDLEAYLLDYCYGVVASLPGPSFTIEGVEEPAYSLPDNYIKDFIPDDKKDIAQSCVVAYNFDSTKAYASVGLEYKSDIRVMNAFGDLTAAHYASQMTPEWKVLSQLTDQDAGRPGYATKSMPFIATRVNEAAGVVDYVDVSFGVPLYVKLTVYPN